MFPETDDLSIATAPYFSYPADIVSLKSSWTGCIQGPLGGVDPPRKLNKATALAPEAPSTPSAAPGSPPIADIPPVTPAPKTDPSESNPPRPVSFAANPTSSPLIANLDTQPDHTSMLDSSANADNQKPENMREHVSSSLSFNDQDNAEIPSQSNAPNEMPSSKYGSVAEYDPHDGNDPPSIDWPYNDPVPSNPAGAMSSQAIVTQALSLGDIIANAFGFRANSAMNSGQAVPSPLIGGSGPVTVNMAFSAFIKSPGLETSTIASGSYVILPSPQPPLYTIGDYVLTVHPTDIVVGGSTLQLGGPGVTIDGTRAYLKASRLLAIGNSIVRVDPTDFQAPTRLLVYTVGDQTFTVNPTAITVDGTSLKPNGPGVTVAGTLVKLMASGSLVIGTSTIAMASLGSDPGSSISAARYAGGDQGDVPNLPAVLTIADTSPSSASTVPVVVAVTELNPSTSLRLENGMLATIGDQTFIVSPSAVSVAGTTLLPGKPEIEIAGTSLKLGSSGILIIGSSTMSIPSSTTPHNSTTTPGSIFTVGGQTLTMNPTAVYVNGTTIMPGGPGATIARTPIALDSSGDLVVGSKTITMPSGNQISQGIGTMFTGIAPRSLRETSLFPPAFAPLTITLIMNIRLR